MNTREPRSHFDRAIALAVTLHRVGKNETLRKYALVSAAFLFAAGLFLSIRELPADLGLMDPRFLVLIATVGVSLRIMASMCETKLSAALVGARFSWLESMRIGLVSSAANMLPLPGGPIVRVAALKLAGAPLLKSGMTTALVAMIWLGLAFAYSGTWLLGGHLMIGGLFCGIGSLVIVICSHALYRLCRSWWLLLFAVAIKSSGIAIGLLRMAWALAALGLDVSVAQVSVFAVSGVAGSAVSFVPAGLGVNESIAALLAPLSAIPPAAAFLAASLNRVVALPVMLAATFLVSIVWGGTEAHRQG